MARRKCYPVQEMLSSSEDDLPENELDLEPNSAMEAVAPILNCRLYLALMAREGCMKQTEKSFYFTADEQLVYENFYRDFGPLNLAMLYRYCERLNQELRREELANKNLIHYTVKDPKKILNAAFLIGCYSIIYLQMTVQSVMKALAPVLKHAGGTKYCDASQTELRYLSLKDCLSGVLKARERNFFDFKDFDHAAYEHYERVDNGDLNWIVPGKFLAFCGPHCQTQIVNGVAVLGPDAYLDYFQRHNVTTVVRLNMRKYDAKVFTEAGFQHYDLIFPDGSNPDDDILQQFLKICEETGGAVAVHCKAGLGRTGTLIGAYLIKHYKFTAAEAIGWLRVCRPGSVIGQQQMWLKTKQTELLIAGNLFRHYNPNHTPGRHAYGIYSLQKGWTETNATSDGTVLRTGQKVITVGEQYAVDDGERNNEEENDDDEEEKEEEDDDEEEEEEVEEKEVLLHAHVQGISQQVDTMRLSDDSEIERMEAAAANQYNNNTLHFKTARAKKGSVSKLLSSTYLRSNRLQSVRNTTSSTLPATTCRQSTVVHGRSEPIVTPLTGTQHPLHHRASSQEAHGVRTKLTNTGRQTALGRTEMLGTTSLGNTQHHHQRTVLSQDATQGDQLNSIKAARRRRVPTDTGFLQQSGNTQQQQLPPIVREEVVDASAQPDNDTIRAAGAITNLNGNDEDIAKAVSAVETKDRQEVDNRPAQRSATEGKSSSKKRTMKGGLQIKMNSKKDITMEIKFDLKQMLGTSASDNLVVDELLQQVYYNVKRLQRTVLAVLESERGKAFKLSANLNLIDSLGLKGKFKLIPPKSQGAVHERTDSTSQNVQIEAPANQSGSTRNDCLKKMTAQVVTELDRNWHLTVSLTFSLFDLNRLFPISSMTQLRLKMSTCAMERPLYQQPIVVQAEMEEWPLYGFSAPLDLGELMFYVVPMLVDAVEVGEPPTNISTIAMNNEESTTKSSWNRGQLSQSCREERLVSQALTTGTASETSPVIPSQRLTGDCDKVDRIANNVSPLHIVGGSSLDQLLQNVESSRCDTDDDRTNADDLTEPIICPSDSNERVVVVPVDAPTNISTEAGKSRIPIYARPGTTGSARVIEVQPELDTNGNLSGTGAQLNSEADPIPKRTAQIPRAAKLAAAGRIQSEDSKRSKRTRSGGNANESQKMRKLGASKQQQGGGGSKIATKGCKRPTERANLADSAGGAKPNKTANSRYKR